MAWKNPSIKCNHFYFIFSLILHFYTVSFQVVKIEGKHGSDYYIEYSVRYCGLILADTKNYGFH